MKPQDGRNSMASAAARPRGPRSAWWIAAVVGGCSAGPVLAQDAPPPPPAEPAVGLDAPPEQPGDAPIPEDGAKYLVSRFVLEYGREHPDHIPIEDLLNLSVELGKTPDGLVTPRKGVPTIVLKLGDVQEGSGAYFFQSGLQAIGMAISREFTRRGVVGLIVMPHPEDVADETGEDLRGGELASLGRAARPVAVRAREHFEDDHHQLVPRFDRAHLQVFVLVPQLFDDRFADRVLDKTNLSDHVPLGDVNLGSAPCDVCARPT